MRHIATHLAYKDKLIIVMASYLKKDFLKKQQDHGKKRNEI